MAIVVDYSMICKSNFAILARECKEDECKYALEHGSVMLKDGTELSYENFRLMILTSFKKYNKKFNKKFGKMVVAVDSKSKDYWRLSLSPYYKKNRLLKNGQSNMPWKLCDQWTKKLLVELSQNFPYTIISIGGLEADDIIAVLSRKLNEPVLIVSRDHDFKQLNRYSNVTRYDPINDKFLTATKREALEYLFEHIIKGDKGDGIPNILSPLNIFMEINEDGKQISRQKPISAKKLDLWRGMKPEDFCETDEIYERFKTNTQLIDLTLTPQIYVDAVIKRYEMGAKTKTNDNIRPYLLSIKGGQDLDKYYQDFYSNEFIKDLSPEDQFRMMMNQSNKGLFR